MKNLYLRHDIDFSMEDALKIALIESELNINSSYFMITSNTYNLFSKKIEILFYKSNLWDMKSHYTLIQLHIMIWMKVF